MKKLISILIIVAMVVCFNGCDTIEKMHELEEENARLKSDLEQKKQLLNNIQIVLQDVSSEPRIDRSEYKSRVYKDLGVGIIDVLTNYFYLVRYEKVQNHKLKLSHCTPAVDTTVNNIYYYYLYGSESSQSCIFLSINQNKYTGNASRIGLTLKDPNADEVLACMYEELTLAFTKAYIMAESSPYTDSELIDGLLKNFLESKKYGDGRAMLSKSRDGDFQNYMISGEFLYVD